MNSARDCRGESSIEIELKLKERKIKNEHQRTSHPYELHLHTLCLHFNKQRIKVCQSINAEHTEITIRE
jgi:hypothetical protein